MSWSDDMVVHVNAGEKKVTQLYLTTCQIKDYYSSKHLFAQTSIYNVRYKFDSCYRLKLVIHFPVCSADLYIFVLIVYL